MTQTATQLPPQKPRNFWSPLLGAGAVGAILLLIVTNPQKPAYVDYAAQQLPKHLKKSNCEELSGNISIMNLLIVPAKDACLGTINGADSVGRGIVKPFINWSTHEPKNLGVLSIYTTDIAGHKTRTVGIAGRFITLP